MHAVPKPLIVAFLARETTQFLRYCETMLSTTALVVKNRISFSFESVKWTCLDADCTELRCGVARGSLLY
jgi:hypothetical protein